jgi:RNA polymerase sigma factor (sigma-70 family)
MTRDELWTAYIDATDRAEPRKALMAAYWGYVCARAQRCAKAHGFAFDYQELASEGAFGLATAIDRYDPERRCSFITYATPFIDGKMLDFLRGPNGIPRKRRLSKKRLNPEYSVCGTPLSPDNLLGDELSAVPQPWEAMARDDEFENWIAPLCGQDRHVMRCYFRDGQSLKEIAAGIGITEQGVANRKVRAMKWLRVAHVNVHERRAG